MNGTNFLIKDYVLFNRIAFCNLFEFSNIDLTEKFSKSKRYLYRNKYDNTLLAKSRIKDSMDNISIYNGLGLYPYKYDLNKKKVTIRKFIIDTLRNTVYYYNIPDRYTDPKFRNKVKI